MIELRLLVLGASPGWPDERLEVEDRFEDEG
jgi:hypothetical protein